MYRSPLDVRNGELPVLPLSIYGALAMSHGPDGGAEGTAAADEFFIYKFDKWGFLLGDVFLYFPP